MSWLHRLLGKDGATQLAVDSWNSALRMSARPTAVGSRGSYSLSVTSGVMAAGLVANSEIFQFRWTHASYLMILRSIRLEAAVNTTAFTAGDAIFAGRAARTWTADGTG